MLPLAILIQPGMKGTFYGRHSTDKQTMRAPRTIANEFAKKYNCEIVFEYEDSGVSRRKAELTNAKESFRYYKTRLIENSTS